MQKYIRKILEASVYDVAVESPLDAAPGLSERLGTGVLLKREDLQPVFSFKCRGAYNKMKQLDEHARQQGVIAASAGNHAQGVALAARKLGIKAVIVMGTNTPTIKIDAVKRRGAKVVLHGDGFDDAYAHAMDLVERQGYTFIHPFDDPDVIAGQGTIGMELLRQHTGPLEAIFVPVGGGGLIAGIGSYVKYLRPDVKVIGVEHDGSAGMFAALAAGRRVSLKPEHIEQFADGTAVRQVGRETYRLARQCVDEVITVTVDEICAAIKDIFEDTRTISEPSGALGVAGMKKYAQRHEKVDRPLISIVSGANMNFDRLRHVAERTEIGEHREMLLGATIPERTGSFRQFCRAIGKRAVTEFNYRYASGAEAHVLVGIRTAENPKDRQSFIDKLRKKYEVADLSDNEAAVLHVRHMVGGRTTDLPDEKLFRFEFPERSGALLNFLDVLGSDFNITMFHYRNHGSAYGRVLAGIEVHGSDMKRFQQNLKQIGYRCWEETDNPAYTMFLR
ncbi:MAG: threonine ammonia-lyase, biosynthetic [Gammaproteobacteria bacterium]|nr:threonine ammonia-lyase, biosynthetic [Gammaproteobacteria bacterium]